MALSTSREAHLWQVLGSIAVVSGFLLMGATVRIYGVVYADPLGLSVGLAASFVMLAGIAGFIAGRVLHAVHDGYKRREAALWRIFAFVCCVTGAVPVILAWKESTDRPPTLEHIANGLAGSFVIMVGVLAILGQRVMQHATEERSADAGRAKVAGV
ncbi:MAG TPA: hypothetical protein VE825_15635 [Terriglobales bacterium]|jgi:peptidoglycan/LPS O-acetylase OafA/YrhL|nr:hypothetical protein [Terriglobales bacterium]